MNGSEARESTSRTGRGWLLAIVVLALVGLATSLYLSVIHWQVHNQPGHVSFCAISEGMNCDTVALSPYAVVAGVPVSTWGALFYLALVVLGSWGFLRRQPSWPDTLLGVLSWAAVAVSIHQFLVAHFVIQAFCIMCLVLYVVNAACGVAGTVLLVSSLRRGEAGLVAGLIRDVTGFFRPAWLGVSLSLLAAGVVVALLVGTPWLYPERSQIIAGGTRGIATGRTPEGHNWIGAEKPELVITEYSDYECPFCRRAHDVVRRVVRDRKDWLRLVHVHVPLDQSCNPMLRKPFHRHACDCARAAICADRQDRFWTMNDALFSRQGGLDAGGLAVLAGTLELDVEKFRSCIKALETEQVLQADLQECQAVAEECRKMGRGFGTPTFTVDKQVVVGLKKRVFWERLVDRLRAEKRGESGTPPATQPPPR